MHFSHKLHILYLIPFLIPLLIQLDNIIQIANEFTNSDIVIDNIKKLENLQQQINKRFTQENFTINKSYSNIIENGTKYLLDIETYLSFAETGKAGFFTKLINSNFKQVAYLEQFTVNGKKCNTKSEILQLKSAIESLIIIHKNFTLLEQNGFSISYDDNSNLQEKYWALNEVLKKIETNKVVVSKIQSDDDFINFSDYTQINLFDIDSLSKKAILLKKDIEDLKKINHRLIEDLKKLKNIDYKIAQSSLKNEFSDFLPIDEIKSADDYDVIKNKFLEIQNQLEQEKTFLNLKNDLKMLLPNTYVLLKNIPDDFITKENFDFASANKHLNEIEFIDLQKCKEELSFINKKIFQIKSEILFNLAKSNFRNKFDNNEIDSFINLLNSYKFDYSQSLKKGIKDNAKFQIAIRKKSSKISKHLSCWVMKFNDVINSLEYEPEIFDCIIVDEASQLNFNSVLLSYYSENIIIVGDKWQTSPDASMVDSNSFYQIKSKFLKDFLNDDIIQIRPDTSLFDLAKMVAGRSHLTLKEHFRCVPEIIEFSKFHFYENSLRPLKQISSNRLNPKEMFFVIDAFTENQIVYKEIEAIKEFLQEILKDEQYSNKSIGVVSLGLAKHTEKLKDIKEELANEFGKVKIDKHKLIIEDSPKFQGDERDVMIVSLGVALDIQKLKDNQNAKPRAIVTDQDEFKKINVALSRAKEQMILFHSVKHEHLQTNDFRNKILSFFKDEAKPIPPLVLDDNNEARNRYNVPIPFDSWFEFDIAKSLINNGYSYIQPQYQVKENETYFNPKTGRNSKVHFKIDLVVYNNGKMIAIECDGDPFHSLTEDVAYDIERQEFLERVGWKIYRVLYSAFKRSPQEEIQKIIDYIEKHTKQEEKIIIPKSINLTKKLDNDVDNNEIEESKHVLPQHKSYIDILEENCETPAAIIQSNIGIEKEKHKSYIDILEEELEESNSDILFAKESKILCYFNIYSDNTYILQEQPESNSLFSLPIEEKFKDGFLLQCYDNGHINKVYVNSILKRRMNYRYSNGKEPNAKIVYLKLIEKDEIIALKIKRGLETFFKAHRTENISNRELLHLKGYKVVYQDADKIEYKILPNNISNDINRLIFASFSAEGKSVHNKYYENEWNIIRKYFKI